MVEWSDVFEGAETETVGLWIESGYSVRADAGSSSVRGIVGVI